MWKRSRLRAKRKIPESMPASAIATENERVWSMVILHGVSPHLPRRHRHARVRSLTNGPLYARNSLGDMLAESSIL
jgi:hypothetical protein